MRANLLLEVDVNTYLKAWNYKSTNGLLLKMLKYFEAMLNIFEFFHVKEIV